MKRSEFFTEILGATLLFALLAFITHWGIVPAGIGLHDADQSLYPLAAEHYRKFGEWSFFPFLQGYAGTAYTFLRAIWVMLFEAIRPGSWLTAHYWFSYGVSFTILAVLFYALTRQFCSRRAALLSGAIGAIGIPYWVIITGMDIYLVYPMLAAIFLIFKSRHENPLTESSLPRLFFYGLLTGFSAYLFRAHLIFVVVFWIPWNEVLKRLRPLALATERVERGIRALVIVLLALFALSAFFGPELFRVGGRPVKLAAEPNLRLAFWVTAAWLIWHELRRGFRDRRLAEHTLVLLPRAGVVTLGAIIGFLPEVFWIRKYGGAIKNWGNNGANPPSLGLMLQRWIENVSWTPAEPHLSALAQALPVALFALALVALVRTALKNPRLRPALILFGFNIIAFFLVHGTSPGATRYFLPLGTVFALGVGVLYDRAAQSRLRMSSYATLALIVATLTIYTSQQHVWARAALTRRDEILAVIEAFKKAGVRQVWSDDYWNSLNFSFPAQENPLFTSEQIPWPEPEHWKEPRKDERAGILISKNTPLTDSISFGGHRYQLTPLVTIGNYRLFLGDTKN